MRWTPRLVGFIIQNRRPVLYFGVSATNEDILADATEGANLSKLSARFQRIRRLSHGAEQHTYAGILPGVCPGTAWNSASGNAGRR